MRLIYAHVRTGATQDAPEGAAQEWSSAGSQTLRGSAHGWLHHGGQREVVPR
jgi:hypothetical protein